MGGTKSDTQYRNTNRHQLHNPLCKLGSLCGHSGFLEQAMLSDLVSSSHSGGVLTVHHSEPSLWLTLLRPFGVQIVKT